MVHKLTPEQKAAMKKTAHMYTVYEQTSGKWKWRGTIQDGYEWGECSTLQEAIQDLINFAAFMNGTEIDEDCITVFYLGPPQYTVSPPSPKPFLIF